MAATYSWNSEWLLNTDWTDTPSVSMVENKPEIGPPIRRMRSYNEKHVLSCSVDMTYSQMNTDLPTFIYNLKGGILPFNFTSPVDGVTYEAYLEGSNGQFYTKKRKNVSLYTVSFKIAYYKIGVA